MFNERLWHMCQGLFLMKEEAVYKTPNAETCPSPFFEGDLVFLQLSLKGGAGNSQDYADFSLVSVVFSYDLLYVHFFYFVEGHGPFRFIPDNVSVCLFAVRVFHEVREVFPS